MRAEDPEAEASSRERFRCSGVQGCQVASDRDSKTLWRKADTFLAIVHVFLWGPMMWTRGTVRAHVLCSGLNPSAATVGLLFSCCGLWGLSVVPIHHPVNTDGDAYRTTISYPVAQYALSFLFSSLSGLVAPIRFNNCLTFLVLLYGVVSHFWPMRSEMVRD